MLINEFIIKRKILEDIEYYIGKYSDMTENDGEALLNSESIPLILEDMSKELDKILINE
jgi:hypothetical protein